MWWSKLASSAAATLLAAGLCGCFQPMYSETAHPGLVAEVRSIEVQPITNTRIGHYLVEDLRADLNGTGQLITPKYRLSMTVSTGQQTPTVNTLINVASSATITADVEYTLVKLEGAKETQVVKDKAYAAAAYDRTTQRYADLRAARDAEIRLARSLADEISTRVGAALAAKPA